MKYKLRQDQIVMLNQLKGKMLMTSSSNHVGIYCITDFKITEEKELKERLFGEDKTVTVNYLTEIKMLVFHPEGKFLASLTDKCVERYLTIFNFYYFRQTWIDFKDQLRAFGFQIVEIPETKEPEETPKIDYNI